VKLVAVGLFLLLAAVAAGQWWLWPAKAPALPSPERPRMVGAERPPPGPPSEFRRPPLEHYKEVWERPLFVEERRPVDEEAEETIVEEVPP